MSHVEADSIEDTGQRRRITDGVSPNEALELLASARRVKAPEALELGLFDRICGEAEALEDCLANYLEPFLARTRKVLEGYKAITTGHRQAVHERLSGVEQRHFAATWTHDDHWRAVERAAAQRAAKK